MISRKKAGRKTKKPKTMGATKVAAPLRQLPGGLMEKAARVSGVHVEVEVSSCQLCRKPVAVPDHEGIAGFVIAGNALRCDGNSSCTRWLGLCPSSACLSQ